MLKKKLPAVARVHINLRKLLQDMSSSVAAMGLTPMLQITEAIYVAVDIALNVLAAAKRLRQNTPPIPPHQRRPADSEGLHAIPRPPTDCAMATQRLFAHPYAAATTNDG